MSKIVAIANQKGGVGKTFFASNVSSFLISKKKTVLMIELDPQGNLTSSFYDEEDVPTEILNTGSAHSLKLFDEDFNGEAISVGGNLSLFGATKALGDVNGRGTDVLFAFIDNVLELKKEVDYIVIDCPPSIGNLQMAALSVADYLIVPSEATDASAKGVKEVIKTAKNVRRRINGRLEILGVVMNKLKRPSSNVQDMYLEQIKDEHGSLMFNSDVSYTVKVEESIAMKQSFSEYSPRFAEKNGLAAFLNEFEAKVEG